MNKTKSKKSVKSGEIRRAQQQLGETFRLSEERLRLVSEIGEIGFFDANLVAGTVIANPQCRRIWGVPKGKLTVSKVNELTHPDDREKVSVAFARAIDPKVRSDFAIENRIVRPDGQVRWIALRGSALFDIGGNSMGAGRFVGVVQDITERKRAEKALRESEERFQLAMLGANDGLWDWNLMTGEVYYSPRWKSMLGYADEELENSPNTWKSLLHPEDREAALARVQDFLEGRIGKYEVEFRLRHKDGQYVDILSRAFMARDARGKLVRLVGTHVDVTGRKQAEESLRSYAMLGSELPDEARSKVGARLEDVDRMIQDVSRRIRDIMAGLRPPVLDDFGLSAALRWHSDLFAKRTGISIDVRVAEPFPRPGLGQEMALFRIAQEALLNASKHAGAKEVAVSLGRTGDAILMTIADDGKGFDMNKLSTLRKESGWGLIIMREKAESLGGHLRIESSPGAGTVITVEIPEGP